MQVPNQSQAETTSKPVRPVSESQPVLSYILSEAEGEVASRAKLRGEGLTPSSPSGEKLPPPEDETGSSPAPLQLSHELPQDSASSQGSSMSGQLSFRDEIAALRVALQCLQESFSKVDSIAEQLKLSSAINHTTASLTRLVRTQQFIGANQPSAIDQALDKALTEVLKDWDLD